MANYAIFDEEYYLAQYPWVQPAIDAGVILSGRDHFETFGQAAGLTQVSRYFDEATYLAGNPELASLVRTPNNPNAPFATGLDHFIQYGYEEGRTRVSPEYDEAFYLAKNQQLQPLIQNGTFKNGYQHFIQVGRKEGKSGTSFNESGYLGSYPDVRQVVESGALKTGREHYFNFGKNEPNRSANFVGTSGNDILTDVGLGDSYWDGVEVNFLYDPIQQTSSRTGSLGRDEFDTLIGGSGRDTFNFGYRSGNRGNVNTRSVYYYIGPGFATIRNFTPGEDRISIPGSSADLLAFPINNNRDLAIQRKGLPFVNNGVTETSPSDTIAVIEGGGNLSLNQLNFFEFR
jgi:hypothetical protein